MNNDETQSGITFRGLRDEADYLSMRLVREQCIDCDAIDILSPEESIPNVNELLQAFPLSASDELSRILLLVEGNSEVIGYQTIHWWEHTGGMSYMHRSYLVPAWRGRGIGTKMLHWAEQSIQFMAAQHHGDKHYRAFVSVRAKEASTLLVHHGYTSSGRLIEFTHDVKDVPIVPIPMGFSLKPATPENYRHIWDANERVFRTEPERSLPTEESYQAFMNDPRCGPSLWSVIWVGDHVVGVAFCEIMQEGVGVITQVSVHEQWRRQSLGRMLVTHALHTLRKHNVHRVYVSTDSDNVDAIRLYRSVNFRKTKEFIRYQKRLC